MFQRILIPIDGSPCSDDAVAQGITLARELGASVAFLHVIEDPLVTGVDMLVYPQELFEGIREAGEAALQRAADRARIEGLTAGTRLVEHQRPVTAILEAAGEADLVVMGTHGRRGFDRYVFGSVAEGVLRRSTVPCLMVRCSRRPEPGTESTDSQAQVRETAEGGRP